MMFRHIIQIDEYIIQIDYDTDIQKIGENVIHESLKGCKSIGKTERHYRPFNQSVTYPKSSLPFITVSDVNQMVSMAKIYWQRSIFE